MLLVTRKREGWCGSLVYRFYTGGGSVNNGRCCSRGVREKMMLAFFFFFSPAYSADMYGTIRPRKTGAVKSSKMFVPALIKYLLHTRIFPHTGFTDRWQ